MDKPYDHDIYTQMIKDDFYMQRDCIVDKAFVPFLDGDYEFEFNIVKLYKIGSENSKDREPRKNNMPYSPDSIEQKVIMSSINPFFDKNKDVQSFIYMTVKDPEDNRYFNFVTMMFRCSSPIYYENSKYTSNIYKKIETLITSNIMMKCVDQSVLTDFFDYQLNIIKELEKFFVLCNKLESSPNKNQIKELFKPCQSLMDLPIDDIKDQNLRKLFKLIINSFENFLKEQKIAITCKNCGVLTSYHPTKIACSDKCRKSLQNKRQYQKSIENDFS